MAKDKKTPSDVSKMIKDREVKLVDFKFTDLPGTWQPPPSPNITKTFLPTASASMARAFAVGK